MLYIIVSVSFSTTLLAFKMCPESIPTVSIVNRCPANATDWVSAAKRKSCQDLGQLQSCTTTDDFVYHCVLNKDATMLLEVCAPTHLMSGYCARFSEVEKRIIIDTGLDCTTFDPPCLVSFLSNESYKYQMCYRNAGIHPKSSGVSQEKNAHVSTASVIFAIIILFILIIIGVGYKLRIIEFACRKHSRNQTSIKDKKENEKRNPPNTTPTQEIIVETTELLDSDSSAGTEDRLLLSNLSGDVTVSCSLEGLKTISALRDKLAIKLGKPRGILFLVDKENGQIFADDSEIRKPIRLMIGNQNRMKCHIQDDEYNDNDDGDDIKVDVISNKRIHSKGNKMSCGHFTVPDTLFDYTKDYLQASLRAGLDCPGCGTTWSICELVVYCNMSEDEKQFFLRVANLNERNDKLAEEFVPQDSAENASDESDNSIKSLT